MRNLRIDRYTLRILFRPGTRQVALLTKPNIVTLWQLPASNQTSQTLAIRNVDALEYSRDGTLAIAASRSRFAQIVDGSTGQLIGSPMRHQDVIKSVSLHPDDNLALTASFDGTATLWNTVNGSKSSTQLNSPMLDQPAKARARVNCATFSPDGRLVATAESDGDIHLWESATGALLRTLHPRGSAALKIVFSHPVGIYCQAITHLMEAYACGCGDWGAIVDR